MRLGGGHGRRSRVRTEHVGCAGHQGLGRADPSRHRARWASPDLPRAWPGSATSSSPVTAPTAGTVTWVGAGPRPALDEIVSAMHSVAEGVQSYAERSWPSATGRRWSCRSASKSAPFRRSSVLRWRRRWPHSSKARLSRSYMASPERAFPSTSTGPVSRCSSPSRSGHGSPPCSRRSRGLVKPPVVAGPRRRCGEPSRPQRRRGIDGRAGARLPRRPDDRAHRVAPRSCREPEHGAVAIGEHLETSIEGREQPLAARRTPLDRQTDAVLDAARFAERRASTSSWIRAFLEGRLLARPGSGASVGLLRCSWDKRGAGVSRRISCAASSWFRSLVDASIERFMLAMVRAAGGRAGRGVGHKAETKTGSPQQRPASRVRSRVPASRSAPAVHALLRRRRGP